MRNGYFGVWYHISIVNRLQVLRETNHSVGIVTGLIGLGQ